MGSEMCIRDRLDLLEYGFTQLALEPRKVQLTAMSTLPFAARRGEFPDTSVRGAPAVEVASKSMSPDTLLSVSLDLPAVRSPRPRRARAARNGKSQTRTSKKTTAPPRARRARALASTVDEHEVKVPLCFPL